MNAVNDYNLITIEVVGTSNPLVLDSSNFRDIGAIVVQEFTALQTPSVPNKPYLSILCNNIRGTFDEKGMGVPVLKTIPPSMNGQMYRFKGSDHEGELSTWMGNGTSTSFEFVWRGADRQQSELIQFTSPYLFIVNLLAK